MSNGFSKTKKCDGTKEDCPLKKKIVAVEFLDGDDKTELSKTGKHFVNLPRDNKWVDGTHVLNIDRLSQKPRVKVRFNQKGSHKFKVKYKPGGANAAYTNAEKGRNSTNFKFQDIEKSYTTDADGTKIIPTDFFVTAAGKDRYTLEATDEKGKKVRSHTIETHRLVYYQEIKMRGVTAATNLNACKAELAKHGITLVGLGSTEMGRIANIQVDTAEGNAYLNKARTAYNGTTASTKAPYVVAIGYTDHLADKASLTVIKSGVKVGPGKSDVKIPLVNASGETKSLWKNIVPGEDWFVSAMYQGLDTSGSLPVISASTITKANCTPLPVGADDCEKVKVKVSGLPKGKGMIILSVNVVETFCGGASFPKNFICLCARAWWTNESTASQNQVAIHELGHKFGMVSDGTGKKPDKPAKYYTGKGHQGPHCHKGLGVKAKYTSGDRGACVMFGSTNAPKAFCNHCTPAIRKMDMSDGWTAF